MEKNWNMAFFASSFSASEYICGVLHVPIGKHRSLGWKEGCRFKAELKANWMKSIYRGFWSPQLMCCLWLAFGRGQWEHHTMNQELFLASEFALQSYFHDTTMHETMGVGAKKKWEDLQHESIIERYHETLIQLLNSWVYWW